MQLSIDLANDEFGGSDCNKDETKILSTPSASRDQTGVGYSNFGAKQAFNFLQSAFTQASIIQNFDPKWQIRIGTNALGYTIGWVLN